LILDDLLHATYLMGGFTTRSDTARENAELVAYASQRGLITTLTPTDGFGGVWRLTVAGLSHLLKETIEDRSLHCQPRAS
jgi:hypothetical protein